MAQVPRRQRVFLTRTAVLDRMCGPLCEAVLDSPGSGAGLADLARSNLLLVPLDRRGDWYRYHHLFRDMLLAELERREPGLAPVLRQRAASWCRHNGLSEAALDYAIAAGDVDTAADLAGELSAPVYYQGRRTTPLRWFRWLDDHGGFETHPMAAVQAALVSAATGRAADAERWADVVDRWQRGDAVRPDDPAVEAWAALLRCFLCRDGVEQMRADTDEAVRRFAARNITEPAAVLYQGPARPCCGDPDGGDASFQEAVGLAEQSGTYDEALAIALCERALLAMARHQWQQAQVLADRAGAVMRRTRLEEALVYAVLARAAVHRGDAASARQQLVNAQRPRSELTYALPVIAVQLRIELIRGHIALTDTAGARALMREVDDLLRRRPGLGTLVGEARALRAKLAKEKGSTVPGASALTAAELRLLPMLATHLSGPEIAAELFLSPHTVKSHEYSLYRKLGTSSRSQTVARARELGLLEG